MVFVCSELAGPLATCGLQTIKIGPVHGKLTRNNCGQLQL